MALNRDMDNFRTIFSEVEIGSKNKLELIRIRQTRGHEIIKSYSDLKYFFTGNLRLTYPILVYNGDEIIKIQYAVQADREEIEAVSEIDFNDSIRDEVKKEVEKFKNRANSLGYSKDDHQKKLLIEYFSLPYDFEENGHNHLIKVGSELHLLHWGFFHLPQIDINIIDIDRPDLILRLTKHDNYDNVSIKVELNVDPKDYNFEWEIGGTPDKEHSGKTIKINKETLQNFDEEFKVKLRVRHSERFAESQSRTELFPNPFYNPEFKVGQTNLGKKGESKTKEDQNNPFLIVKISSSGNQTYRAELNKEPDDLENVDYEWKLNDQVIGNSKSISLEHEHLKGLPGNSILSVIVTGDFNEIEEEATDEADITLSTWDRILAWWADPSSRRKFFIALALILFVLFLIFLLNRNSISGRSTDSDRPVSQTSQNRTDGLTSGSDSQRNDQQVQNESGVTHSDRNVGPPSGSVDEQPPVSGNTIPPSQDRNEPIPPFTPRGNDAENDLTPNQIREIENSPDSGPTKIGDIFCVESAGKVKVWMKLSGGNIYILDSYNSEHGSCSHYYPGN